MHYVRDFGQMSLAEQLALDPEAEEDFFASIDESGAGALKYDWGFWARPKQLPPPGNWRFWLILAGRGFGKALCLNTEIPTPAGWATMGSLRVGDAVFDENGVPCRVTFTTDVMHGRICYDVVFDDGSVVVADAEHLWLTKTRALRKAEGRRVASSTRSGRPQCERRYSPGIVTTEEIRATLMSRGERNHSIDVSGALDLPVVELPVDPYVLGVWLGDGHSASTELTSADAEVVDLLRASGCSVSAGRPDPRSRAITYQLGTAAPCRDPVTGRMKLNGSLHSKLSALGLLGNKRIPAEYLRASAGQRLALLQGLMDTDGSVTKGGHCEYVSTSETLARGAHELALTLGIKATVLVDRARLNGRDCGPRYRMCFTAHTPVFRLSRKLARQHGGKAQAGRIRRRYIVDVRPRASVPVRCIQVDSTSHLFLAGRSFIPTHNTRSGAQWVLGQVESGVAGRIALIGQTASDVRDVIVEGESGILACAPPWNTPKYEPSKRRLTWPNGAIATTYSGDEPDQLRGPQHDAAWCEEICKWRYAQDAWDQLCFGLRLGKNPRAVLTSTPRPTKQLKDLLADKLCVVTRGSTFENAANVSEAYVQSILAKYEGTRLGRQELYAEVLDDSPGALWKRGQIDDHRVVQAPEMRRIVVAIDPSVSSESEEAETGIIVAGLGVDGHGYVLADLSLPKPTPEEWGRAAVSGYHLHAADAMIAEVNNGGDLVASNIRSIDKRVSVKQVRASRGKHVRAEPVASLGEQGRIHHVGCFPRLEDEQCEWELGVSKWSPNRMDAYVWAFTELMLGGETVPDAYGAARKFRARMPKPRM